MNYLAHLFLAQPNTDSRVGNLLGDFARGIDRSVLSEGVHNGLLNHWLVDRFTDQHIEVKRLKELISLQRRRFSGIILDVVFDHYLIKHWEQYAAESFAESCSQYYADLRAGHHLMPLRMQQVTARIVEQDWFSSYSTLEGVGYALDRITGRIRFPNAFAGAIEELELLDKEIEHSFLRFMPALLDEVRLRGPERTGR